MTKHKNGYSRLKERYQELERENEALRIKVTEYHSQIDSLLSDNLNQFLQLQTIKRQNKKVLWAAWAISASLVAYTLINLLWT